mmetsp:Transcript_10641/g.20629  ORF Transcript_10641/g.20629 Transcript_10641/m.20629 type:complete len:206 (+) Transcript_10641:1032-1649(+)
MARDQRSPRREANEAAKCPWLITSGKSRSAAKYRNVTPRWCGTRPGPVRNLTMSLPPFSHELSFKAALVRDLSTAPSAGPCRTLAKPSRAFSTSICMSVTSPLRGCSVGCSMDAAACKTGDGRIAGEVPPAPAPARNAPNNTMACLGLSGTRPASSATAFCNKSLQPALAGNALKFFTMDESTPSEHVGSCKTTLDIRSRLMAAS